MTSLGEAVRRGREQRGLGQERVAAALGVSQQTVSRWEHGLAVPRPGRVVDLARLLDLEAEGLHRLAGYLPAAEPAPVVEVRRDGHLRMAELSRAELLQLIERARDELRSRDAADALAAPHGRAAAG